MPKDSPSPRHPHFGMDKLSSHHCTFLLWGKFFRVPKHRAHPHSLQLCFIRDNHGLHHRCSMSCNA
uniref:Uncharacterized protein n=1 Tax=Rhizophora mucronata TaxID=61149 RepID=A0A2P2N317_RHIMU